MTENFKKADFNRLEVSEEKVQVKTRTYSVAEIEAELAKWTKLKAEAVKLGLMK